MTPKQIRRMIPKDLWICFEGYNEHHSPKEAGSYAMTAEEYRELVRAVDVS